jgi:hypothetical protein
VTKNAPALTSPEAEYYDRRAERQLELAERARHPDAVAAHCAIADRYMTLRAEAEALAA